MRHAITQHEAFAHKLPVRVGQQATGYGAVIDDVVLRPGLDHLAAAEEERVGVQIVLPPRGSCDAHHIGIHGQVVGRQTGAVMRLHRAAYVIERPGLGADVVAAV